MRLELVVAVAHGDDHGGNEVADAESLVVGQGLPLGLDEVVEDREANVLGFRVPGELQDLVRPGPRVRVVLELGEYDLGLFLVLALAPVEGLHDGVQGRDVQVSREV